MPLGLVEKMLESLHVWRSEITQWFWWPTTHVSLDHSNQLLKKRLHTLILCAWIAWEGRIQHAAIRVVRGLNIESNVWLNEKLPWDAQNSIFCRDWPDYGRRPMWLDNCLATPHWLAPPLGSLSQTEWRDLMIGLKVFYRYYIKSGFWGNEINLVKLISTFCRTVDLSLSFKEELHTYVQI